VILSALFPIALGMVTNNTYVPAIVFCFADFEVAIEVKGDGIKSKDYFSFVAANAIFFYLLTQRPYIRKKILARAHAPQERSLSLKSRGVVAKASATLPSREVLIINVQDERKCQQNEIDLSQRNIMKKDNRTKCSTVCLGLVLL